MRHALVLVGALGAVAAGVAWTQIGGGSDANASVVRAGASFKRLAQPTSGRATLVVRGDSRRLTLGPFHTYAAPELYVYVIPGSGHGGEVRDGGIRISRLRSVDGRQQYRLPKDVSVDLPLTVVVWCDLCHKAWGEAVLGRSAH